MKLINLFFIAVLLVGLSPATSFASDEIPSSERCRKYLPDYGILSRENFSKTQLLPDKKPGFFDSLIDWGKNLFRVQNKITEPLPASIPIEVATLPSPKPDIRMNHFTEKLTSYIVVLLSEGIINTTDLVGFRESIISGAPQNIIGKARAIVSSIHRIHVDAFNQMLDEEEIEWPSVLAWIENRIVENSEVVKKRTEAADETVAMFRKIKFNEIIPSDFTYIQKVEGREVELPISLTYPIEVMETKVTEAQWAQIFGRMTYREKNEPDEGIFVDFKIGDNIIEIRSDVGVTKVQFWAALVFANELSRRHGLRPAYDLSKMQFWEIDDDQAGTGRLEPSSLLDRKNSRRYLEKGRGIKINAPNGDIYQTEGYRLPTLAEQLFLLSELERKPDPNKNPTEDEWVTVQGQKFSNLFEGTAEWSWDNLNAKYIQGVNPAWRTEQSYEIGVVGVSPETVTYEKEPNKFHPYIETKPAHEAKGIGFRLVRTLPRN